MRMNVGASGITHLRGIAREEKNVLGLDHVSDVKQTKRLTDVQMTGN